MKAVIQRAAFEPGRRVIVLSDIHGHLKCLEALLRKLCFSPQDVLVVVGDLVNRGPDSLGALRYLMRLCRSHTVYPLMGNNDWTQLAVSRNDPQALDALGEELLSPWPRLLQEMWRTLAPTGALPRDLAPVRQALRDHFEPELSFLRGLPTILDTPDFTFVHAGLDSADLEAAALWRCLKNDAFEAQGRRFDKYLVVGHWPVVNYCRTFPCYLPRVDRERKIVSIDGGMGVKRYGQLNALILPPPGSGAFQFAWADGFPVRRALDAQAPSEHPVMLGWNDNEVRVLATEDGFSYCEQRSTGTRLWVLNSSLYALGDALCAEGTDYRPPVQPGDALSILAETARGVLVKREGVMGWYDGRLAEEGQWACGS